jgi:hypothetical protein
MAKYKYDKYGGITITFSDGKTNFIQRDAAAKLCESICKCDNDLSVQSLLEEYHQEAYTPTKYRQATTKEIAHALNYQLVSVLSNTDKLTLKQLRELVEGARITAVSFVEWLEDQK